jgi:phage terminase large subunit-like protein
MMRPPAMLSVDPEPLAVRSVHSVMFKLLDVTSGDSTDYAVVRAQILKDYRADGMKTVFFDPKTARETAQILMGDGVDMVQMPQGFFLHESIKRTLELIVSGDLCHGNEPILSWMASNLVLVTGIKGEQRIAKERSADKIDGMAALVMGIDGAVVKRERQKEPQLIVIGRGRS